MIGAKAAVMAILVAVMMMATTGLASAADVAQQRDVQVNIYTGSTDKMNGGDWVAIRAGDVTFAVVYGTESNPNNIVILSEQKRYLGGADIFNDNGDFIRSSGIPVDAVFAARLVNIIEYRDVDANGLFDLKWLDDSHNATGSDQPVKYLSLKQSWLLTDLQKHDDGINTTVDFTVAATNLTYTAVRAGDSWRPANAGDGTVDKVAFTFHMKFVEENKTIQMVPWYHVVVKDNRVVSSTPEEPRNSTSEVLNGTIKYDQLIQGWDFANNNDKLAVEVGILAGIHAAGAVAGQLRDKIHGLRAETNDTEVADEEGNDSASPVITRDSLRIENGWERIGNWSWKSDVKVDGNEETMKFQVQNGGTVTFSNGGNLFVGFLVRAAFLYPAGQTIFHDPLFQATSTTLSIQDRYGGLSPNLLGLLQLVAVLMGLALAIALGIFVKRHNQQRPPAAVTQQKIWPPAPYQPQTPAQRPVQPPLPTKEGGKKQ